MLDRNNNDVKAFIDYNLVVTAIHFQDGFRESIHILTKDINNIDAVSDYMDVYKLFKNIPLMTEEEVEKTMESPNDEIILRVLLIRLLKCVSANDLDDDRTYYDLYTKMIDDDLVDDILLKLNTEIEDRYPLSMYFFGICKNECMRIIETIRDSIIEYINNNKDIECSLDRRTITLINKKDS